MPYTPDVLIRQIARLQATADAPFPAGLFPAYRSNPRWAYWRPDANLFATAITVFTIQQLRPFWSADVQQLADDVVTRARAAYELFRNQDGLNTYNFYPTRPSRHFPNGYVMQHLRHFKLPDDIDDTAMVYLTTSPSAEELRWLHQKLAQHAGGPKRPCRTTFDTYQTWPVYSTWFGQRMNIEFDVCALSNLLYCLLHYGLPLNAHDHASLALLRDIVQTDRYRTHAFRCAHNYARPALITYHLSRLVAAFDPAPLRAIRPKLLADARADLAQLQAPAATATPASRLDQLLLATSLLRLGDCPPDVSLTGIGRDFDHFHFFIGCVLSAYDQPWIYRWAHQPFWHIQWHCEAHNWALVLEYVTLRERTGIQATPHVSLNID